MAGPTPSASLVLNEVIHLLAGPSPSANPAEPNPEVVIVWMKSESIGCTKSKCSPAQSSDKVNVIQGKWWIFWLGQAQVPVRLSQVLKRMIKLLLSNELMEEVAGPNPEGQPDWMSWWMLVKSNPGSQPVWMDWWKLLSQAWTASLVK